jgi:hypothetical protein
MNEYRMEMTITCATGDADHFYNTVLMIAKGFEIGVLESKLGLFAPNEPKSSDSPPPVQTQKKVLTIKEASIYLNISKSTLYKYTTDSLIPHLSKAFV